MAQKKQATQELKGPQGLGDFIHEEAKAQGIVLTTDEPQNEMDASTAVANLTLETAIADVPEVHTAVRDIVDCMAEIIENNGSVHEFRALLRKHMPREVAPMQEFLLKLTKLSQLANIALQVQQEVSATIQGR